MAKAKRKSAGWRFHHANTLQVANRIAKQLMSKGKDVRVRPATKRKGFTVWERD